MATIPGVADNELIRTYWGDAVADELNNNIVKKTGAVITGNVSVSGTLSAGGRITCGGDMVALPARRATTPLPLSAATVGVSSSIERGARCLASCTSAGQRQPPLMGCRCEPTAQLCPTVTTGAAPNSLPNLLLGRTGTQPQAVGGTFVRFERTSAGTDIGSITIASASAVAYNTTSDPRLKEPTGDVADAADIVHDLGAKVYRGRWIADQGQGDGMGVLELDRRRSRSPRSPSPANPMPPDPAVRSSPNNSTTRRSSRCCSPRSPRPSTASPH